MTTTAPDLTTVVDTHLAAYGEPDAAIRERLLAEAWAPDGVLLDPPITGEGRDGIARAAAALQQQFPGHGFRRTTAVDAHHGVARYGWVLESPDGTAVLAGLDVADVDAEGRLRRIVGFFGEPEPLPAG